MLINFIILAGLRNFQKQLKTKNVTELYLIQIEEFPKRFLNNVNIQKIEHKNELTMISMVSLIILVEVKKQILKFNLCYCRRYNFTFRAD